jgi:arylsulfatase A-like enzyme
LGFHEVPKATPNLPLDEDTFAEELQGYGYRTALVGKWHLGFQSWAYTPLYRGFDSFYGINDVNFFKKHLFFLFYFIFPQR